MSKHNSNFQNISRKIYKYFGSKDKIEKEAAAHAIFRDGINFSKYGTIELGTAFGLHDIGFLKIFNIEIDEDNYHVAELDSKFMSACKIYQPPEFPWMQYEEPDEYALPCGTQGNESAEVLAKNDPRGGGVFLMTEEKLRAELKARSYKWLLYRTPYRPGSTAEMLGETLPPRIE